MSEDHDIQFNLFLSELKEINYSLKRISNILEVISKELVSVNNNIDYQIERMGKD